MNVVETYVMSTRKSVQRVTANHRPGAVEKTRSAVVRSAISTPKFALTVSVSHLPKVVR